MYEVLIFFTGRMPYRGVTESYLLRDAKIDEARVFPNVYVARIFEIPTYFTAIDS